jgi:hypothetical protein
VVDRCRDSDSISIVGWNDQRADDPLGMSLVAQEPLSQAFRDVQLVFGRSVDEQNRIVAG